MNQIIASVVLFGIVTAVIAPLIWDTGLQIFSRTVTVSDVVDASRQKAGQVMVSTHIQQLQNRIINIYISNIGIRDITPHVVLVDGIESPFVMYNQDYNQIDTLVAGKLGTLNVTGAGSKIQIITTIGKLFEYDVT